MNYVPKSEIAERGYRVLAGPYNPVEEFDMIQGVLDNLERGSIPYVFAEDKDGVWVCRTEKGWLSGSPEIEDDCGDWLTN